MEDISLSHPENARRLKKKQKTPVYNMVSKPIPPSIISIIPLNSAYHFAVL